jgi:hypothetical protein
MGKLAIITQLELGDIPGAAVPRWVSALKRMIRRGRGILPQGLLKLLKWRRKLTLLKRRNAHPNIPAKRPKQALNVKQEMKVNISELAVSNIMWVPKQLYDNDIVRAEMDRKYPSGWCGTQYNTAIDLVCNTRYHLTQVDC